jgi:hypothetical protein
MTSRLIAPLTALVAKSLINAMASSVQMLPR